MSWPSKADFILAFRQSISLMFIHKGISVISVVHAILILRLYGLYGTKKLVYALSILLALTIAAEFYVAVKFAPNLVGLNLGKEIGEVCTPNFSHKVTLIW